MNTPPLLADAAFCAALPKAELHVHIEGTLTAPQKLALAKRNGHPLAAMTLAQIEQAHDFGGSGTAAGDLQQMLDCYYGGIELLSARSDFFDAAVAYLSRCHQEGVRYAEISFDPQAHTSRGVALADVMNGLHDALQVGRANWGVQAQLILCINRDRSVDSALATLDEAAPYRERGWITGLGLDSNEAGNPPAKFVQVYRRAKEQGYRLTAHCDVDQVDAVRHIWQCIDLLGVERIDHGVNCLEDRSLVTQLRQRGTCMTVCPTWRPRDAQPRRVERLRAMLQHGLRVTVNSDDPGLLASGTLGRMLPRVASHGRFTRAEMAQLFRNAFLGAWLGEPERATYLRQIDALKPACV